MQLATRIFKRTDWYVTSGFGERVNPVTHKKSFHYGEDYGTHLENWTQYALEDGVVSQVGYNSSAGNYVRIIYKRINKELFHAHLKTVYVKKGDHVNENTGIGLTGKSGTVTGIHMHLGLKPINGSWEDPSKYDYIPPSKIIEPTERKYFMNQIEVIKDKLRERKSPSLKGEIIGYAKLGFYTYSETVVADGYTWYKIGSENWIAGVDGYVKIYPYKDYVDDAKEYLTKALESLNKVNYE